MDYTCSFCGDKIQTDLVAYVDHTEQHVVDLVKHDHPGWVEKDGMCQKCLDYYRSEIKGSIFKDVPCVTRNRKIKNFFAPLTKLFKK